MIKWKRVLFVVVITCLVVSPQTFAKEPGVSGEVDFEYLKTVMEMIQEQYNGDVTDRQLIEGALDGMFGSMDDYTEYYTTEEANQFLNSINGEYQGVGVEVSKNGKFIQVTKVFDPSPAKQAGIMKGDMILEVDGQNIESLSLEEATGLIKGAVGTKVKLGILRNGQPGMIRIEVRRDKIKISPVSYDIRNGIGYIKLDMFSSGAGEHMEQALNEMDQAHIEKIILDLRDNPGGDVDQAVSIAKKFVPEGVITKLDFKSQETLDIEYRSYLKEPKYQVVVLVNGNSASASEILAGAIQDTKAGVLVGTKTFGKAKVQNVIPLLSPAAYKKYEEELGVRVVSAYDLMQKHGRFPSDEEIIGWTKITTGVYTTPNGRMIDGTGLTPDIYVENETPVQGIDIRGIAKLNLVDKPTLDSEGWDVYNAEKILKIMGYSVEDPDMVLDSKTFQAISKFQEHQGLYPYGVLDFTTQKALNLKLNEQMMALDKQYSKAVELLIRNE